MAGNFSSFLVCQLQLRDIQQGNTYLNRKLQLMFDPQFSFVIIPSEASTDSFIDDLQELDITVGLGVEGYC